MRLHAAFDAFESEGTDRTMNRKNPNGLIGYRTPTEPPTGNVTRLLKPQRGTVPEPTKGQAIIARAKLADPEAQFEDLYENLNRSERRVLASEARAHKKALARRDAVRKLRADKKAKKFARGLVEL